jgi:hypothetical protein
MIFLAILWYFILKNLWKVHVLDLQSWYMILICEVCICNEFLVVLKCFFTVCGYIVCVYLFYKLCLWINKWRIRLIISQKCSLWYMLFNSLCNTWIHTLENVLDCEDYKSCELGIFVMILGILLICFYLFLWYFLTFVMIAFTCSISCATNISISCFIHSISIFRPSILFPFLAL